MEKLIKFIKKEKWGVLSVCLTVLSVLIGSPFMLAAEGATVAVTEGGAQAQPGHTGAETQIPGQATTVSGVEQATGGVGGDGLIQPEIDEQIFEIGTDETVLDGIMRKAKRQVKVKSFEVDHYIIDEQKAVVEVSKKYTAAESETATIEVASKDAGLFQEYGTILAKGVNGYDPTGQNELEGVDLMLFIVGKDSSKNGSPIVRAINGPKSEATDMYCNVPTIEAGTKLVILSNACAETQKNVAPDIVVPSPNRVYLQKSIMNQIVSDYFDSQKKRIPFQQATIAEAAVKQYRRKNNRTLWIGQKGKVKVDRGEMGVQDVYFTEGVRWQIKREWQHDGNWTFEEIIALAKLKFTGSDCSKEAFWLMGRDQLESIQNIDFTKHKDITMTSATTWGFSCTKLHTVFGDFYLKHEPTLDVIGYANSGAILDMQGLVRYWYKNEEKSTEDIEGEEAKRQAVISINALALKGFSHIWVEGDYKGSLPGATVVSVHDNGTDAPVDPKTGQIFYLKQACTGISGSKAGEFWKWNGSSWEKYEGEIYTKNESF